MGEILAILEEQSHLTGTRQAAQSYNATIQRKTPIKHISRRRSVFSLANEWLKPKTDCNHGEIMETTSHKELKSSWSQFFSLRGPRGKKDKTRDFATNWSRSSSPQKKDAVVVDECNSLKPRRRRSLQDLLGTMTGKISRRHSGIVTESSRLSYETVSGDRRQAHESFGQDSIGVDAEASCHTPNIALPEPAMEIPAPHGVQHMSSKQIDGRTSYEASSPGPAPATLHKGKRSTPNFVTISQLLGIRASHISQGCSKDNSTIQQSSEPDSHLCLSIESIGTANNAPGLELKQQDLVPPSPLLGKQSPIAPTTVVQRAGSETLGCKQIRFEESTQAQNGYNIFEVTKAASDTTDLDPSFCSRAQNREVRYRSICGEEYSPRLGQSDKEIEHRIDLTAAKMSKNLHLLATQSVCSLDSSGTRADEKCYWDGNESEVWSTVARGQMVMSEGKLSPYLHLRPADAVTSEPAEGQSNHIQQRSAEIKDSNSAVSELLIRPVRAHEDPPTVIKAEPKQIHKQVMAAPPHAESFESNSPDRRLPSTMNASTPERQTLDSSSLKAHLMPRDKALDLSSLSPRDPLGSVIPKTRAMYTPRSRVLREKKTSNRNRLGRKADTRQSSIGPVNVVFPESEFCAEYTKTFASKSDAIGDLYQNYDNYSDHYLFDRATRTIFPQAKDRDFKSRLQTENQGLELLWLPMQCFPNPRSLEGGNKSLETFCDFGFGRSSPSEEFFDNHFDKILTNSYTIDQNMLLSDSHEGYDLEGMVLPEYPPSIGDRDSNSLGCPDVKATVREVSGSILRDLTYENDKAKIPKMEDPYGIEVANETMRQSSGSIFLSSIDSPLIDRKLKLPRSDSADSIWYKIEDSRLEEAKRVKTWAEMGKDFLDTYAPLNQTGTEQRAQVAVRKALSTRGGLPSDLIYERGASSSDNSSIVHNLSKMDERMWSRDRSSDDGVTFHHVEDIVKYESAKEPSSPKKPFTMNRTQEQSPEKVAHKQESDESYGRKGNIKGKNKEKGELEMPFLSSWAESGLLGENLFMRKEQEPNSDAHLIGTEFPSTRLAAMNRQVDHSEPTLAKGHQIKGNHSQTKSETGIAPMFGNGFALIGEQPGTAEDKTFKKIGSQFGTRLVMDDSKPLPRSLDKAIRFPITEDRSDDKTTHHKRKPLISAMASNVNSKDSDNSKQTMQRMPIPAYPEAEGASSFLSTQRLLADTNWVEGIAEGTSFPESDVGKTQTSRPDFRNVLAPRLPSSHNLEATYHTAHTSDAETEVSEGFGEKLRRYGHPEDEKENEEQWWREFVSYG